MDAVSPDFKALFESVPGLYLVLDPQLRIIALSDAYLAATMTRRSDVLGRWLFDVFPDNPDDPTATGVHNLRTSLERVLRERVPDAMALQKYDVRRPADEGAQFEERWWSPLNSPVFDANGELTCIIHRAEDVTEFVRLKQHGAEQSRISAELEERVARGEFELYQRAMQVLEANQQLGAANSELSRLNNQLRELDELKTQFFANVSHELRTPLTLILGPIRKHLQDGLCPMDVRADLEVVERNARLLLTHVNDLLDISKLEAGRMQLRYTEVDVAQLAREVLSHFESIAMDRNIAMKCTSPQSVVAQIDTEKLRRIYFNLLSNALKFTPDGGAIGLSLSVQGDTFETRVEDTGPGIPPYERDRVFERFHQVQEGASGRSAGTGLGLSIVREFSTLHNGEVTLDEAAGGGARFTVRLPLRAPAGTNVVAIENLESSSERVEFPPLAAMRRPAAKQSMDVTAHYDASPKDDELLLVVEDNPDLRKFLLDSLRPYYRVALAEDGQDGLEKALTLRPDLILSDMMMPRLGGDAMVAKLRENVEMREVPIIFLTAKEDDGLRVRLLQQGAQDYISKPFSVDELLARVDRRIADRRAMRNRLRQAHRLESVGRLASGIAHDFNNLLTAIIGYAHMIIDDGVPNPDPKRHAQGIVSVSERAATLTHQLLAFARKQPIQPKVIDMNEMIKKAEPLLRRLIREDIDIKLRLLAQRPAVTADPGQIEQVLINLGVNARDAIPGPGLIRIETYNRSLSDPGTKKATEYVVLAVTDTGVGMDESVRANLFEPFFTTKEPGRGTGLGLASSYGIVQRAGGQIQVESEVGRGTTFEVYLPVVVNEEEISR